MTLFGTIGALSIALGLGMTGMASAVPLETPAQGDNLVTSVAYDCHEDVRFHFLPEYGRKILHRHRQSNCRVVVVDRDEDDDYNRPRDCHRDVRRHYLPEYGANVTHKHVGDRCRVKVYERNPNGGSGGSCIRIGIIQYCEN